MNKISILGAGESGVGAAVLAKQKGYSVYLSDRGVISKKYRDILLENKIDFEEKNHDLNKILSSDEVVKSPGIPDNISLIEKIKQKNIEVISEIEFAYRFCDSKIIAITGSNGKTTTASLIYHILKHAGLSVGLAGNIGNSFAGIVNEKHDFLVLELSSFQLDGIVDFKPYISVITNISEDHLDRYDYRFDNYINSKFRIVENQKKQDFFIYDNEDLSIEKYISENEILPQKLAFSISDNSKYVFLSDNNIVSNNEKVDISKCSLKGVHNAKNIMVCKAICDILNVKKSDFETAINSFSAVEHRLEFVKTINEIEFVNDSKATNIDSAFYALQSMEKPVVWIVGGVDKGNDYKVLEELVAQKVKAIVCLGEDNSKIIGFFKNKVKSIWETKSMTEAVKKSYDLSEKGDVVLLAPACASFDLFENYEKRGEVFKNEVNKIVSK